MLISFKISIRECHRLQTPRLLRASILSPGSTNLVVGVPQQQCLPQVWRSETVVQVFLDFWMEYTEDDHMPSQMNMSYSTPIPHRVINDIIYVVIIFYLIILRRIKLLL